MIPSELCLFKHSENIAFIKERKNLFRGQKKMSQLISAWQWKPCGAFETQHGNWISTKTLYIKNRRDHCAINCRSSKNERKRKPVRVARMKQTSYLKWNYNPTVRLIMKSNLVSSGFEFKSISIRSIQRWSFDAAFTSSHKKNVDRCVWDGASSPSLWNSCFSSALFLITIIVRCYVEEPRIAQKNSFRCSNIVATKADGKKRT